MRLLLPLLLYCYAVAMGDGILGAIGEEFKKLGKSATSQVTGSDDSKTASADPSTQLGGLGKSLIGQITGNPRGAGQSQTQDIQGQLGGFGSSILGQVTGADDSGEAGAHNPSGKPRGIFDEIKAFGLSALGQVSGKELAEMKQKDDAFSEASEAEVKARIKAIYDQHAARRAQEAKHIDQQKKQVQEQKQEFVKEKKEQQMDVAIAQTKANAEIKNMGAE